MVIDFSYNPNLNQTWPSFLFTFLMVLIVWSFYKNRHHGATLVHARHLGFYPFTKARLRLLPSKLSEKQIKKRFPNWDIYGLSYLNRTKLYFLSIFSLLIAIYIFLVPHLSITLD